MEPGNSRINQAEIARALGLSQSTVSIALKGDTRVAKKTRDAIKKKAEELGGTDYISLNLYRTKAGALLRPCEMPEAKVIAFVRHLVVDAAPNDGRGAGSY